MTILVNAGGEERRLDVKKGENLMKALLRHGINIPHPCHGKGKCEKCRVGIAPMKEANSGKVISDGKSADKEGSGGIGAEKEALEGTRKGKNASDGKKPGKGGNRLACLTVVREPLVVSIGHKGGVGSVKKMRDETVVRSVANGLGGRVRSGHITNPLPHDPLIPSVATRKAEKQARMSSQAIQPDPNKGKGRVKPPTRRVVAVIPPLPVEGATSWERVVAGFSRKDRKVLETGMEFVLPHLAELAPPAGGPITLVRAGSVFLGVCKGNSTEGRLGLAIGIEGEEMTAILTELMQGREVGERKVAVPTTDRDAMIGIMQKAVTSMCSDAGRQAAEVTDVVLAARSSLLETLTGLHAPMDMGGQAVPTVLAKRVIPASRLGLKLAPHATAYLPPAESAVCGPDCVMATIKGDDHHPAVVAGALTCLLDGKSRKAAEKWAARNR